LFDQALALKIQPSYLVVAAQRVQLGPAIEVFERVIGTIICSPADEALQVTFASKYFRRIATRRVCSASNWRWKLGPLRRRHRNGNRDEMRWFSGN
jgi:hypothetical protein